MRHPRAKLFFALYACAIVYLSLYPWEFTLYPRSADLYWVPLRGRRVLLDAALNLLFYAPLGAAGFLAVRRGWFGWALAVAAGSGLSWTIEWLQLWSLLRYGNLTDLSFNIAGTVVGATLAFVAARAQWAHAIPVRWRLNTTGILFLAAWVLWHTFPFIPEISLRRLTEFATLMTPWSWLGFAEHIVGFAVLRLAMGRSPWLWLALAVLLAQGFLVDRSFALSSVCGAALGWVAIELTAQRDHARWLGIGGDSRRR